MKNLINNYSLETLTSFYCARYFETNMNMVVSVDERSLVIIWGLRLTIPQKGAKGHLISLILKERRRTLPVSPVTLSRKGYFLISVVSQMSAHPANYLANNAKLSTSVKLVILHQTTEKQLFLCLFVGKQVILYRALQGKFETSK